MKSFKEYLEEAKYTDWNYEVGRRGKFESDKNNIYYAQQLINNAPKEMIADIKSSLEKDGKLPTGDDYENLYKAMFVMKHAADTKNLSQMPKELSTKQADFEKLVNNSGLDTEQVLKSGETQIEQEKSKLKDAKSNTKEEEPSDTKPNTKVNNPSTQKPVEEPKGDDEGEESSGEESSGGYDAGSVAKSAAEKKQEIVNLIKSKVDEYSKNGDTSRRDSATKVQNKYETDANKIISKINKKEDNAAATKNIKLKRDYKREAEKLISGDLSKIGREAKANIAKVGNDKIGDKLKRAAKNSINAFAGKEVDAYKRDEDGKLVLDADGNKIPITDEEGNQKTERRGGIIKAAAGSKVAGRIGELARNTKAVGERISNSKTAAVVKEKATQVTDKVLGAKDEKTGRRSGGVVGKVDAATVDLIKNGKESKVAQNVKKGAEAVAEVSKKAGSAVAGAAQNVGKAVGQATQGVKTKVNQAGQTIQAGVNAMKQKAEEQKAAEQKPTTPQQQDQTQQAQKKIEGNFINPDGTDKPGQTAETYDKNKKKKKNTYKKDESGLKQAAI